MFSFANLTRIRAAACIVLLAVLAAHGAFARPVVTLQGNTASISTSRYLARLTGGSLVYFKDRSTGEVLLQGKWISTQVWFVERGVPAAANAASAQSLVPRRVGPDAIRFTGQIRRDTSIVLVAIDVKARENELIVTGHARATGKFEGLASMTFPLGATMPRTEVIVPTTGGNSYRSDGLRTAHSFDWPINWEAAMLQVQGKRGGLLVCAFEPFKRFKNLRLAPGGAGWNIVLESENCAPFEGQRRVQSLEWHIRPYTGEWRRGASIYRDWHHKTFKPDPGEEPSWVQDIRAEIHCGTDPAVLDALVSAGVDPRQTLLYVAGWRTSPYDVNYPDYTPADHLAPFMEKAHMLGFRVMLHANYFGCDPKMPDYARFKPFQIRHRYSGELQWWEWTRAEPPTKFAYINPASRDWRRLFVARMAELVRRTGADAIHLDQTLCIFNDRNGLIDGLNMAQGNLLLHKELKAALPTLALSGEGLDEVTMIHEAFAQRHVAGIDHVNGTWSRASLEESHPISAYLFGGRTKPYEYLGSGSPDNDQMRLAWRDAYRHWGVLPGFGWPTVNTLANPSPSARQALDEIIAHQRNRLDPWIDGPWPARLCVGTQSAPTHSRAGAIDFPYRSASGEPFAYVSLPDGWSLCRTDSGFKPVEELSRVVTGAESVRLPGTIPGAFCYDRETVSGLDPGRYYIYSPEPRDLTAFHLDCGEEGTVLESACAGPNVAFARIAGLATLIDTPDLLARAETCYLSPSGKREALTADLSERTGVVVQPRGSGLFMHPQWKGDGIGVGEAEVVFNVSIPKVRRAAFTASCRLDQGAVGKSDGVVFRAIAECGGERVEAQATADSFEPVGLSLPLQQFAGKRVTIHVAANAGPKHSPTYDWGLLENLRVTISNRDMRCRVVAPASARHLVAPVYRKLDGGEAQSLTIPAGGAVMVTSLDPTAVTASVKLSVLPQLNLIPIASSAKGEGIEERPITLAAYSSGGVERKALFSHPPDRGIRTLHYFIQPPAGARLSLKTAVGIRDGSKSEGVRFAVWLNGNELWSKHVVPTEGWVSVDLPLGKLTGDPVMITLVTDSEGSNYYDWALWADPELMVQ